MKTKDIADSEVVEACASRKLDRRYPTSLDVLANRTGAHWKVCMRAMERAVRRGYIECGVSLRTAWPTRDGLALLKQNGG